MIFFSPSKQSPIPKRTKSVITKACTEFCALDGRAFDVMKGIGFQNLSIALLETGVGVGVGCGWVWCEECG